MLLQESGESLVIKVSQNTNYTNNNIRCLSWHPHCIKIAVAASDDSIRVFSQNSQLVPLLKCKTQRLVTSLTWRYCHLICLVMFNYKLCEIH